MGYSAFSPFLHWTDGAFRLLSEGRYIADDERITSNADTRVTSNGDVRVA